MADRAWEELQEVHHLFTVLQVSCCLPLPLALSSVLLYLPPVGTTSADVVYFDEVTFLRASREKLRKLFWKLPDSFKKFWNVNYWVFDNFAARSRQPSWDKVGFPVKINVKRARRLEFILTNWNKNWLNYVRAFWSSSTFCPLNTYLLSSVGASAFPRIKTRISSLKPNASRHMWLCGLSRRNNQCNRKFLRSYQTYINILTGPKYSALYIFVTFVGCHNSFL